MAFSQADLDTIESAIKDGVRSVRLDNRTIEYQSITQMLTARDAIKEAIEAQAGVKVRHKAYRARYKRGLD